MLYFDNSKQPGIEMPEVPDINQEEIPGINKPEIPGINKPEDPEPNISPEKPKENPKIKEPPVK